MIVSIAVAAACKTCDMENQRLKAHQAGVATEAPPAIPLGMEERLELSLAALLSSIE